MGLSTTAASHWIEFTRVSEKVPIVFGALAPGIFTACNARVCDLEGISPQHLFLSCGPDNAALHTSLDPKSYPRELIGMDVAHHDDPVRLHLTHGAGAGLVVNALVAGAGAENEEEDATGETRQKLRHCGTGYMDMKHLLDHIWASEEVCIQFKHAALPDVVSPLYTVRYKATTSITPGNAPALFTSGFFCTDFEASRTQLVMVENAEGSDIQSDAVGRLAMTGEMKDTESTVFTRLYTQKQNDIAHACTDWINGVMTDEEKMIVNEGQNGRLPTNPTDLMQKNEIKKYMCSLKAPWFPAMNGLPNIDMYTGMLANYIGPTRDSNDPSGAYKLVHAMHRSGIASRDWAVVADVMIHELVSKHCSGPVPDAEHLRIATVVSKHYNNNVRKGHDSGAMHHKSMKHVFSQATFFMRMIATSTTASPNLSKYSYDQAVLAQIVQHPQYQRVFIGQSGPTECVTEPIQQKYICTMTENMATGSSVFNTFLDGCKELSSTHANSVFPTDITDKDKTDTGSIFPMETLDDCETLANRMLSVINSVVSMSRTLGLDTLLDGKQSYATTMKKIETAKSKIVDSNVWDTWKLRLTKEARELVVDKLFWTHHCWVRGNFSMDLGLVVSGGGNTDSTKMQHQEAAEHTAGVMKTTASNHDTMKRFRFVPDKNLKFKQVAGDVGGHCIAVLQSNLDKSAVVEFLDKHATTQNASNTDVQVRDPFHETIVCEGTSAAVGTKPCNGKVLMRLGDECALGSRCTLGSSEATVTGCMLDVQHVVNKRLMFTPGSRLQINLPVDESEKRSENNPFPSFYRSLVVLGNRFAMTSDGVPGVDIVQMCTHGIQPHKGKEHGFKVSSSRGFRQVDSFKSVVEKTPKRRSENVSSMLVPLVDENSEDFIAYAKHVRVVRHTMDPPCVSGAVYRNRLANNNEIHGLDNEFPPSGDYAHYMPSSVYVPAREISLHDLTKKCVLFNSMHEGVCVGKPIWVGSTNKQTGDLFVPIRWEVAATPT
jgi:hypothetical protein